jgi:7-cyano-7-deazaguanine synthase
MSVRKVMIMTPRKKVGKHRPKALVLLSGGLDSSTAAAVAQAEGYEVYGLTVLYGQRHAREVKAAKAVGRALGLKGHFFSEVSLGKDGSALLDRKAKVPVDRDIEAEIRSGGIPSTYVPARNLVLLSIGAHWAEVIGAEAIFTGFNVIDYSGYPDCSQAFVKEFQRALALGTKAGRNGKAPRIITPLIGLDKAGIIRLGTKLKVPYMLTWSCYKGGKRACGRCDSCRLRLRGFEKAGLKDPVEYED